MTVEAAKPIALDAMISEALAADPRERAIEQGGQWHPRGRLRAIVDRIDALLAQAGVDAAHPVGIIARNRIGHVAALLSLLSRRRAVVMLHAYQAPENLARELRSLRLAAVIADRQDWAQAPIRDAVTETGGAGIELSAAAEGAAAGLLSGLDRTGAEPFHSSPPDTAIEVLTSGTTGAPKRVAVSYPMLGQSINDAALAIRQGGAAGDGRHEPFIQFFPLGNISGLYGLLLSAVVGRPLILMEKFSLDGWLDAVRTHRLSTYVTLPPAGIRALMDANVTREDLASLTSLRCGSAPLDPELQAAFEQRYGVPILIQYGATEFCGVIANWTLADHRDFALAKRGSVGRARPGVELRVVDVESGAVLPAGQLGQLSVRLERMGGGFVLTNDLAFVDADGFVFLKGRADGVIIRGGFKLFPDSIAAELKRHPSVRDAVVVGIADQRLGEVPVAAVELRLGASEPRPGELEALVRERLSPQHVPVRSVVVPELPRNGSLKIDRGALKRMLTEQEKAG
jgi:acyl-CoA synthetase (AMP-forming)/AMP-acid ligase II